MPCGTGCSRRPPVPRLPSMSRRSSMSPPGKQQMRRREASDDPCPSRAAPLVLLHFSVPVQEPTETQRTEETAHYLVYLSGIGAISGDYLEPTEIELCDELAARFPGTVVVKNVFPYAMNNRGLTGHRIFSSLWRGIERLKIEGKERLLPNLINIRNLFQMVV